MVLLLWPFSLFMHFLYSMYLRILFLATVHSAQESSKSHSWLFVGQGYLHLMAAEVIACRKLPMSIRRWKMHKRLFTILSTIVMLSMVERIGMEEMTRVIQTNDAIEVQKMICDCFWLSADRIYQRLPGLNWRVKRWTRDSGCFWRRLSCLWRCLCPE